MARKAKKEKKPKDERAKMKRITILTAIVSLVMFLYKMGLGILTTSLVLMIGSLSTLLVFICKVIFIKYIMASEQKKLKAYLFMTIAVASFVTLFILFAVLKVSGIDTSNQKTYEGWLGTVLILVLLIMFILSINKLKSALGKSDLTIIGIKEMTFISALTDLAVIEEFIYRIITNYVTDEILTFSHKFVPTGVAVTMIAVPIIMVVRYVRRRIQLKKKTEAAS